MILQQMAEQTPSNDELAKSNDVQEEIRRNSVEKRTITLSLLRKRSEHNECMVSTIEELALHQEELESIGVTIGRTCGKTLKILLLQNNVISSLSLSEMKYFKVLKYLNLALNNLTKIQGLECCQELEKIDLTLNFIDFDELKGSLENMKSLSSLRELYIVGNPCCRAVASEPKIRILDENEDEVYFDKKAAFSDQNKHRMYVVSMLPQLKHLDGTEIHKSERIVALQHLPELSIEVEQLSEQCKAWKEEKRKIGIHDITRDNQNQTMTTHSPEARSHASRKTALEKAEREKKERVNQPRTSGEKEWEEEQKIAVQKAAEQEERGEIRQKNEGRWTFHLDESQTGHISLDVSVPRHLSTSLIDVDVHPTYISIIIKSKILRLKLPVEVKSNESKAQRSTTTGHLVVTMPRVNPQVGITAFLAKNAPTTSLNFQGDRTKNLSVNKARSPLTSQLLEEGSAAFATKNLANITKRPHGLSSCVKSDSNGSEWMTEVVTSRKQEVVKVDYRVNTENFSCIDPTEDDDSEPPPFF